MEQKYYWVLFSYNYKSIMQKLQCLADIHPIKVQEKLDEYYTLMNWKELTKAEYDQFLTYVVHYTEIKIG